MNFNYYFSARAGVSVMRLACLLATFDPESARCSLGSGSWTYPKYFAVLVVAVLPRVVLPGYSEHVLVHIA